MSASLTETSDLINVRQFLSSWDTDVYLQCAGTVEDKSLAIAERMDLSSENVDELEAVCSVDQLKASDEPVTDRWSLLENIPDDLNLACVRHQRQELEKRQDHKYFANMIRKMKYKFMDHRMIYDSNVESQKNQSIPAENRVVYPDVVITLNVHRPVKYKKDLGGPPSIDKNRSSNTAANTFLVLGRQCLTDLRDSIRCVHDLTVAGDLSENPDTEAQCYAKDLFKSGLFFIEGTFYNDMRESNSLDYSRCKIASTPNIIPTKNYEQDEIDAKQLGRKPIIEWSEKQGICHYKTKKMEETTFLDLNVRLGQPYLYMHQGNCEHWLIFNCIRLLSVDDPQNMRDYPYLQKKSKKQRTLCRVCYTQAARWITYNSEHAPENPCFFCEQCFRALHYDNNNKKIGHFEAYKYFDYHAII